MRHKIKRNKKGQVVKTPVGERFWDKVDKGGKNECWEWQACRLPKGYGVIRENRKNVYAHRASYKLNIGNIPNKLYVLHKCDNPPCVNPNHLFLGTAKDNTQDMIKKKRGLNQFGERNIKAKLTAEVVKIIRELYKRPDLSQTDLAREFNISSQLVNQVVRRKSWKHI